jgi:arylsulfatase A-like enzyme
MTVCFLALTVLLALGGTAHAALQTPPTPNILFIITDDQRLDGTMVMMPKTTKWFKDGDASAGIIGGSEFPNAVDTTPLCCPARSSIFTGKYAHNHGVERNSEGGNLDQNTTLQHYLMQAGYRTGIIGKFLNTWDQRINPPNWTNWAIYSSQAYSGFEVNEQGSLKWNWKYSTNYVAEKAEDFLQTANDVNDSQPWFLYVAPTAPHGEFNPEPKYANASAPPLQQTSSYFEADRSDKPYWVQTTLNDSDDVKADWPNHLRLLKSADDLVDGIMTKLQALNEGQDTLAFFMSDNGLNFGEHGLTSKKTPYREAIRVPFYLRWPGWTGHTGTRVDNRLVANIDMAPTALTAAGITPPGPMDGRSLLDVNTGRSRQLTEAWGTGPVAGSPPCPGQEPTWAAIHTLTYHYIEHYETTPTSGSGCEAGEYTTNYSHIVDREYYDITPGGDPMELTNLLGDDDPSNDPPTGELSALLAADRTCSGATCAPTASDPDTLVTSHPQNVSGSSSATFAFTSSEPNGTFQCRIDDFTGSQTFMPCYSNDTWSGLTQGPHKLEVRAVAPGGAVDSTPDSFTWSVDTSKPETEIGDGPPKTSTSRAATFEFASPNAGAFECRLDSTLESDFQSCATPQSYSNLADGSHTFEVRAVRSATEIDPTPASRTWTIDATKPDTVITPDSSFSTHRTLATFNLTSRVSSSSSQLESPGRLECKLDTAAYSPCSSTKTYTHLSKGAHTLMVRSTDLAGNTDPTPAVFNWTIDAIQTFSSSTDSSWPQVTVGNEIRVVLPDATGGFYIAGDFSEIGFPNGQRWQRTDLAHIKADKTVDEAFKPSTDTGSVRTMVGRNGVLYIGGTFTGIKGSNDSTFTTRNRIAAVTASGNLTSWNPNASNAVYSLGIGRPLYSGAPVTTIHAAGAFQAIGGVTRRKVAEINFSDGTVTSWNPDASSSATLQALAVTERTVYVGGINMTQVGGKPRNNLAEIDRFTGQATDWNPNPNGSVNSLFLRRPSGDLPAVYVGGLFTTIGQPSVPRSNAAEISIVDNGTALPWDPSPSNFASSFLSSGCTIHCSVLMGGAFKQLKSTSGSPVARSAFAETDRDAGNPQDWNPSLDRAVYGSACGYPVGSNCDGPNAVFAVGGLFNTAGGVGGVPLVQRGRLAFFKGCPLTTAC